MYHNTIHIIFTSVPESGIDFTYNFLISKDAWLRNHQPIEYQKLLDKFHNCGINPNYINFPDVADKNKKVFCEYNGTPLFEIFFKAYERVLKIHGFNITFEYGSMIKGKFYPNNMNFYSSISFERDMYGGEDVITGVNYKKRIENYQIVDKCGKIIDSMSYVNFNNFESEQLGDDFFKSHKVSVYLRKYKLDLIQQSI